MRGTMLMSGFFGKGKWQRRLSDMNHKATVFVQKKFGIFSILYNFLIKAQDIRAKINCSLTFAGKWCIFVMV